MRRRFIERFTDSCRAKTAVAVFAALSIFTFLILSPTILAAPPMTAKAPNVEALPANEAQQTAALTSLADSFGPRLAGAIWLPNGRAFGTALSQIPMARFLEQVRVAGAVTATGRWLSGLPLPPEGWSKVLAGPALLIWVRPVEYGAFQNQQQSSTLPEKADRKVELALVVHLEPKDRDTGRSILRWLARDGLHQARQRDPEIGPRRRRVAGAILHVWERYQEGGKPRPVLAYALDGPLLVVAGDEGIVGEVLARRDRPPPAEHAGLTSSLFPVIADARRLHAPVAGVFDVHAFPIFESADWITDGLGLGLVGKLADRLSSRDERTSEVVAETREQLERLGERAATGGIGDLSRLEILYWPDPRLPHSRVRLVFKPNAHTWMEELAARQVLRTADLAPADCVAFWTLRVPQLLAGKDAEQGGAEIGRMFIPTRFRIAGVWTIEMPRIAAFLRTQITRVDDFFATTTLDLPVKVPLSGPWERVKEALRKVEPWMPLAGVKWKVRLVGDSIALSTSQAALEKLVAVDRGKALSLRASRPDLFSSATSIAPPAAHPSKLGPGRMAYERFSDIAHRAALSGPLDIISFPFLQDPGEDSKLLQINYLALAQKIPKVKEWLATLPPEHSRVVWYPQATTIQVTTQSASGLPGDPRVWGIVGASLIPTFDLDLSGWNLSLDELKKLDLELLDPRRWLPGKKPEKKDEP